MNAYAGSDYVGADGQSYPEVAARAVQDLAAYKPSPFYGYARSGRHVRIYFFETLPDAQSWFSSYIQQPDHDYASVFALANLNTPMRGLEHFRHTAVGNDPYVGNWWPFFLGLPLGAAGGYFARRWQEPPNTRAQVPLLRDVVRPLLPGGGGGHGGGPPAKVGYPWLDFVGQDSVGDDPWVDFVGNCPSVGDDPWLDIVGNAPWMDIVGNNPWVDIVGNNPWVDIVGNEGYSVGAPWVDFAPWVGAQADDAMKRQASAHARALIQAATQEVAAATGYDPTTSYWVWWLAEPGPTGPASTRMRSFEPATQSEPYSSRELAMDRVRQLGQQPGVIARAVFDKTSRHWPSPVTWSKSSSPEHLSMIAQYVSSRSPTSTAGEYVGAWDTAVGSALLDVQARARMLAQKRRGDAIGVIHTTKDNLWHAMSFDSPDDADDWFNTATQNQNAYTYAAYFDKRGNSWPDPYIEKIGGYGKPKPGPRPKMAPIVGATHAEIEAYRSRTQKTASAQPGAAVVVVITSDGLEHTQPFRSLDDAIDGLTRVTGLGRSNYAYAGAFDKGVDGTAYVQQEEFGDARVPMAMRTATIRRDRPATTSGDWE